MWKLRAIGLVLVVFLFFGCQLWQGKIPEELIGEWVTSEPRYKNRVLQITKEGIVFFTSPGYVDANTVIRVRASSENGETLYEIRYKNDKGENYTIALYLVRKPKGNVIRLKNQPNFEWTKIRK
jgi:hypothetical protein